MVFFAVAVIVAVCIVGCGAINNWRRGQARADARNSVSLTQIQVQNQNQYARVIEAHNKVVKDQAYQRFLESQGIRASQDEIAKTLTPLYVQYEAIKAMEDIANSGRNNTVIYLPSGQGGVPLITAHGGTGK